MLLDITLKKEVFTITVSQDQKLSLHHKHGIHMLYFDQLATISKYLSQIKINEKTNASQQ